MSRIKVDRCVIKDINLKSEKIENIIYMLITMEMVKENKLNIEEEEKK